MNCPCQSGETYENCCGRFISHQARAENARQLMRSRFTAHVLKDTAYLSETWHPDYRPPSLQLEDRVQWIRLDIINFCEQGETAEVEFEALFIEGDRVDALHEKSRFVLEQGHWFYTNGEMLEATRKPWKPGRNSRCPCGSGLKFKRCCAK